MIKGEGRQKYILTTIETCNNYQILSQGYLDVMLLAKDLDISANK